MPAPTVGVQRGVGAPSSDDVALMAAAAGGDNDAVVILWERHSRLVRGIIARTMGPGAEIDDLVHEVFLRLFQSLGALRNPGSLRGFLISITMHVIGSELRKKRVRRWLRLSDDGVLPEPPAYIEDERAREALGRLYTILDELDARSRMAFVLRHLEGLELTEVAAALDCSLATVKRVLERAGARVQARMHADPLLAGYLPGENTEGRP